MGWVERLDKSKAPSTWKAPKWEPPLGRTATSEGEPPPQPQKFVESRQARKTEGLACSDCPMTFSSERGLAIHMARMHGRKAEA